MSAVQHSSDLLDKRMLPSETKVYVANAGEVKCDEDHSGMYRSAGTRMHDSAGTNLCLRS